MNTTVATAAVPPPLPRARDPKRRRMANALRALAMDAVEQAKSGHPGMPMGMADVATVLFTRFLRFDPLLPDWPDRDRFVLSAGHGSMLLYALGKVASRRFPLSAAANFCDRGASCRPVSGRRSPSSAMISARQMRKSRPGKPRVRCSTASLGWFRSLLEDRRI